MDDGGLPAETEPPVSEDLQQRGIDFLQGLLASGKVDLDRFQKPSMLCSGPYPGWLRLMGRSGAVNTALEPPMPSFPW